MKYLYYPGCSAKATGRPYEESLLAVFKALQVPLDELQDWNCCGATAYMSIDEVKAFALAARNLALAEKQNSADPSETAQLIAPCAACWLVLVKTQKYVKEFPAVRADVDEALQGANLQYRGKVAVRHPLDVLVNDISLDTIKAKVKRPLQGLKVASYYGCQLVRPFPVFDSDRNPQTMDQILKAVGAEPLDWPLKTRCCGGSLSGTIREVGMRLSFHLLKEAKRRGADVVATACPLCQFNLECHQQTMEREYGEKVDLPVAFFTQILGAALGVPGKELGLQRLFRPLEPVLASRCAEVAHAAS
jgi:heterodisulfide reductase subunit B2